MRAFRWWPNNFSYRNVILEMAKHNQKYYSILLVKGNFVWSVFSVVPVITTVGCTKYGHPFSVGSGARLEWGDPSISEPSTYVCVNDCMNKCMPLWCVPLLFHYELSSSFIFYIWTIPYCHPVVWVTHCVSFLTEREKTFSWLLILPSIAKATVETSKHLDQPCRVGVRA